MAFASTTLTVNEAQSLQTVLVAELQDASISGKTAQANIQAALAKLRAHIQNLSAPMILTASEATTIQTKLAATYTVIKTSSVNVSTSNKIRN